MWPVLHLIARPFEALLGVFCVVTAIMLYPDEEGKIQSKFEELWIRIDDYKNLALSRHTIFMQCVAQVETRALNRLLSPSWSSSKALSISFCLSVASGCAAALFSAHYRHSFVVRWIVALLMTSLFVAAYISMREWREHHYLCAVLLTVGAVALVLADQGQHRSLFWGLFSIPLLFASFFCDFGFLVITRHLVEKTIMMDSAFEIAGVIGLNVLLAVILISPGVLLAKPIFLDNSHLFRDSLVVVSLSNLFDAVFALLFVLLAALLLVHHALWPLLTRTLFRMQDIGTKGRRAILTTIGIALLGTSVFGGRFPELVAKLIEKLGG